MCDVRLCAIWHRMVACASLSSYIAAADAVKSTTLELHCTVDDHLTRMLQARKRLAGRETELKAMRARVTLQNSYIEKLEDEQSGFAGARRHIWKMTSLSNRLE